MKQHNYVLKHLLHAKLLKSAFSEWEKTKNIVEKVKNVKKKKFTMLDEATGSQQRHLHMYPIILTSSLVDDIPRYLLRVKTFQNSVR